MVAKNKNGKKPEVCLIKNRKQQIMGILGLVALFLCGVMVGNGIEISHKKSAEEKSVDVAQVVVEQPQDDTCVVIEEMFLGRLVPEYAEDYRAHEYNIKIYQTLIEHGCPENIEKYNMMIAREQEILSAFKLNKTTCGEIENLLQEQMPSADGFAENRIMRAKIYANLAERGCAENSDMYVKLAQKELEIARALKDDEFNRNDTIEVVETYKRLDMQAAAEEVFEKAKKLTNPAIDFILEIEKIINE